MRLFTQLLRPGMTVVDAGANIGEYTLVAARRVAPGGSVHAFEPTPAVVDWLRRNVALNDLHNVVINPVALSNAAGDVELFFDPMEPVSNSIVSLWHATGVATVPATTLDEYVGRAGLAAVDVLKIDVEGAEIMALEGAGRLLAGEEAPIILVEANEGTLARSGRTMRDLIALLEGHGYACGTIDFHGGDARYSNLLAAKPAHRRRFPIVEPIIARGA
jgi:FkbM family methyltransferase